MNFKEEFFRRLHTDWEFLIVAITTFLVGANFLINPGLLESGVAYSFIVDLIDDAIFSVPICLIGALGIIFFILNKRQFRAVFLVFYQFIWTILSLAYLWRELCGFHNSTWIMSLSINVMIFFVALWGDDHGK